MSSRNRTRDIAATAIAWIAVGVAAIALLLWAIDVIRPPVQIFAGTAAVLVILAGGRLARVRCHGNGAVTPGGDE
jgi:uncharacterized membrane protein YhhN